MKADDFASVPEELISHVVGYGRLLERRAIALEVEPFDVSYPKTPHLRGMRASTTTFFEVVDAVDLPLALEWSKFGHMADSDTRFVLAVPSEYGTPTPEEIAALADLKVGLDLIFPARIVSLSQAHDLAVSVELPVLPEALLGDLAEAYELFEQGHWKEGFENACVVLQVEAKRLLLSRLGLSRMTFQGDRGPIQHTATEIGGRDVSRMTLGQLAKSYAQIASPNLQESRVGDCLARVNDDRVTVAHFRDDSPDRTNDLRRRVGKNMMTIVNGLKFIRGL